MPSKITRLIDLGLPSPDLQYGPGSHDEAHLVTNLKGTGNGVSLNRC